ncbi:MULTISPECIES: ABC transporter permease [unclassified Herbaspirillum]|uniref:ABC transporter permease n=1 Tax=unclassified Herbaspirillum TaxID=2624150 RepID=UPI000E2E5AE3|nr:MULTISPECIES: ABC transporter permease [unclassified Herbaspirillum]RFB67121.1 ABC transporter permease [Herbaspirillum sp. 3R-3a1]TFI06161.1 ABC transporter permease [Herbaspirillum sp. 3R11]TFI14226.1 ABC transporter permease [Herbaspirillum sp. 3R-11]TFI28873.1 ABC transporter permease [Herbaspirillum sp. 3C11]
MTDHKEIPSFHSDGQTEEQWDVIIEPRGKIAHIDLASVWRYRDLIWMFFKRDFITFYKQTVLGPLWYLIQPIVTATTYYIVFGKIANLSTNGLPPFLFYISGIVLWSYFSACLTNNSEVFSKNSSLFSKVYFPRLVVPISVAMSGLVALAIQFLLLILVSTIFAIQGTAPLNLLGLLYVPLLVLYIAVLGMGTGLIVSAMTVRFRDLVFAVGFATQLWMYATPVVYPFGQIPERYQWFYYLNPMTSPIETLRATLYGAPAVKTEIWISNLAITAALLVAGLVLFSKAESNAMDTV